MQLHSNNHNSIEGLYNFNNNFNNYNTKQLEIISKRFYILIKKIFKFINKNDIISIQVIIKNHDRIETKLQSIYNIINKYNLPDMNHEENRKCYIAMEFYNALTRNKNNYILNNNSIILDIGGGNGDMLEALKNIYYEKGVNFKKDNLICVETKTDWNENYLFQNENITFHFWNNEKLQLDENLKQKCDIIICMVSLHHMYDNTIDNILTEIYSMLKPNGLLFIKEHNYTAISSDCIIWEHHLYHIMDCKKKNIPLNAQHYLNTNIYNFKSANTWQNIIQNKGFQLLDRTNRFLGHEMVDTNHKNGSQLYWDIYKKL